MRLSRHEIDAVCLDVDGTLYSIRKMIYGNVKKVLPLRRFFKKLHSVRDEMRYQGIFDDFQEEQAIRLARILGASKEESAQLIKEVVETRWMAVFKTVDPYPGLVETLRKLKLMGIRLAVLSDYPIGQKLVELGMGDLEFDPIVNSEEHGTLKPNAPPFQAVIDGLGVAPERILHVGDREEYDIEGALDIGMRAALFLGHTKRRETKAEFAFRDWRRLLLFMRWKGMVS